MRKFQPDLPVPPALIHRGGTIMSKSNRPTAAISILMSAYLEVSGLNEPEALRTFREQQKIILERRSDAGAQLRRDVNDPGDREEEYQKLDRALDEALFRALWSHFPQVRAKWPSSNLRNNELELDFI